MANKTIEVFDRDLIKSILRLVHSHEGTLTPKALIDIIRDEAGLDCRPAKSLIAHLVSTGKLEYLEVYGRTCVSPSFNRPVRISQRIVLKPPDCSFKKNPDDVVINLISGTSFGRGTHPTTKLCIRLLDWLFDRYAPDISFAVDIGTGTGILALTAASLGVKKVEACDIDPMAIHEAKENVIINKLENHIHVGERCDFTKKPELILANLRYPTLISLYDELSRSVSKNGWIILSGIKKEELDRVRSCYEKNQEMIRTETVGGWSSLIYRPCQHAKKP